MDVLLGAAHWIQMAAGHVGAAADAAPTVVRAAYDVQAALPYAADAARAGAGSSWGRWVLEAIDILAVSAIVLCVPIQRRAMNRIAFGRSMFISIAAIVTGFIISLIPTLSGAIVGSLLMILGFGFMILLAVKSFQHLRRLQRSQAERNGRQDDEAAGGREQAGRG